VIEWVDNRRAPWVTYEKSFPGPLAMSVGTRFRAGCWPCLSGISAAALDLCDATWAVFQLAVFPNLS